MLAAAMRKAVPTSPQHHALPVDNKIAEEVYDNKPSTNDQPDANWVPDIRDGFFLQQCTMRHKSANEHILWAIALSAIPLSIRIVSSFRASKVYYSILS